VYWWTVMNAVAEHGAPLVDDPGRIGRLRLLGGGEAFARACPRPGDRAQRAHDRVRPAAGLIRAGGTQAQVDPVGRPTRGATCAR
jgi:hypothetical protein